MKLTTSRLKNLAGSRGVFDRAQGGLARCVHLLELTGDYARARTPAQSYDGYYDVELQVLPRYLASSCSCPYGRGCKHVVALGFYLLNTPLDEAQRRAKQNSATDDEETQALERFVRGLKKQDLVSLVIGEADDNDEFREALLVRAGFITESDAEDGAW